MRKFSPIHLSLVLFFLFALLHGQQPVDMVNVFIGTGGHGHTFPGAVLPFGMVQLSPDQRLQGWDWCSGYHYSDSTIMGFSHTHLSGTGASDLGDILFMPYLGPVFANPGPPENPATGYRSAFTHEKEQAEPGYYSVLLLDDSIHVELTVTDRCGFQRYTFPHSDSARLIIDLSHGISDEPIHTMIRIVDNQTIMGSRRSRGWAQDHIIFFYARFSAPFVDWTPAEGEQIMDRRMEINGTKSKMILRFDTRKENTLLIKTGISAVDVEGARNNLIREIPGWDFDSVRYAAREKWNRMLSRVQIADTTQPEKKTIFYTALYHSLIHPSLFSDADGRYRGMDGKIYQDSVEYYTIFSLWDTFRAAHPLYHFLYPEYNRKFVISLLKKYREFGKLPMWELHSNDTYCMTGNHAIPVIAEEMLYSSSWSEEWKKLALEAVVRTSLINDRGMYLYRKYGFVPSDAETDAVTKTLEYAYDDYAVYRLADIMGETDLAGYFLQRSSHPFRLFDEKTGFFRGRNQTGLWVDPFDPIRPSGWGTSDYTEGNAWQYLWFIPHDIPSLIKKLGGQRKFAEKLDQFLSTHFSDNYYIPSDISGLIGLYAHGNEPVHHVAYLYNYAGQPVKTQRLVRLIMDSLYTAGTDGYPGNEDCGQMSAWFVFSALGFYPVDPVAPYYLIGTPLFDSVTVFIPGEKPLTITARRESGGSMYIRRVERNEREYPFVFLNKSELKKGGKLEFDLTDQPAGSWGTKMNSLPPEMVHSVPSIPSFKPLFLPYEESGKLSFLNEKTIRLRCETPGARIVYSESPDFQSFQIYQEPLRLTSSKTLHVRSELDSKKSRVIALSFHREIFRESVQQEFPRWMKPPVFHHKYQAGGKYALLDGHFGGPRFTDGKWQGIYGNDLDVIIDLGKEFLIDSVSVRFLKNHGSWIFLPVEVIMEGGTSPDSLSLLYQEHLPEPAGYEADEIRTFSTPVRKKIRFVRLLAVNPAICPPWHSGAGNQAFMFVDEISIIPSDHEKISW